MAESIIQLPPDSTGKSLRTFTGGASATHQQAVVSGSAATATLSNVTASASSVSLLASTVGRLGMTLFNDSTADLNLKFGATASATSYTIKIGPGQFYEMASPIYTGAIDGIWTVATGTARITELT